MSLRLKLSLIVVSMEHMKTCSFLHHTFLRFSPAAGSPTFMHTHVLRQQTIPTGSERLDSTFLGRRCMSDLVHGLSKLRNSEKLLRLANVAFLPILHMMGHDTYALRNTKSTSQVADSATSQIIPVNPYSGPDLHNKSRGTWENISCHHCRNSLPIFLHSYIRDFVSSIAQLASG